MMVNIGRVTRSLPLTRHTHRSASTSSPIWIKSPKDLGAHLSNYIIGQERAKKILSVAVFNHYHRISHAQDLAADAEDAAARKPRMTAAAVAATVEVGEEPDPTKIHDAFGVKPLPFSFNSTKPPPLLPRRPPILTRPASARKLDDSEDVEIEKSNVLMIGPTGSGKTLLAKTLAKILDVPFASCDATTFTQAGYVGEDVESSVLRLLQAADYDVARTEMGIIHIDECDKLARRAGGGGSGRDVGGEGVQQALLRLLEGSLLTLTAKPPPQSSTPPPPPSTGPSAYQSDQRPPPNEDGSDGPMHSGFGMAPGMGLGAGKKGVREGLPSHGGGGGGGGKGEVFSVDTSGILFIVSGAFVGLDSIISRRLGKGSIGFGAPLPEPKRSGEFEAWDEEGYEEGARRKNTLEGLSSVDLVEYGFIPEFVGRLPVLATLHSLSLPDLIRVLTEPKNALVKQYTAMFKRWGTHLRFSDAALLEIAKEASRRGGSARHLRATMEDVLLDSMWDTPNSSAKYVAITADVVRKECVAHHFSRGAKIAFQDIIEADDRKVAKVEEVAEEEVEEEEKVRATG